MRSLKRLQNDTRRQAQGVIQNIGLSKIAIVTSYDPNAYAAKVLLQPIGIESGWLPIKTIWVGNGWGLFCPPSQGDQVQIDFQEGSLEAGIVQGGLFNDEDRPLPVPSGEFWIVHQSGSSLKFLNDGRMTITAIHGLEITGEVAITGSLDVSGNVTIGNGASGSFTSAEGLTIVVQDGINTAID